MKVKTEMIIWGVVLVLALIFALNYKIIFGSVIMKIQDNWEIEFIDKKDLMEGV